MKYPSLYLDGAARHFDLRTTDFGQHTEITLQDVRNEEYALRLYVDDRERKLRTKNHRIWTPAQRLYVCPLFTTTYTH